MTTIPTMRFYLNGPNGRIEEGFIPSHGLMSLVGRMTAVYPELTGGLELRLDGIAIAGASGWYLRVFRPGM